MNTLFNLSLTSLRSMGRTLLALPLCAWQVAAAANNVWPVIALPEQMQTFAIGEQLTTSGIPLHLQGFVSSLTPTQLAPLLRRSLGQPLVEQTSASALVLGRAQGDYYLTVKLEPAGNGSRGWISLAQLKLAYENRLATRLSREALLARLPYGSRIISDVSSNDDGKLSRHILATNNAGEESNVNTVKNMMEADGLNLQRDNKSATNHPDAEGRILLFRSKDKDAMASVRRNKAGNNLLIINTVTQLEQAR